MTTAVAKKSDSTPFEMMDRMDDKAIAAELEGRIVDTWAYHFNQGGKEIWGLSKVGVDQACREMAKNGEVIREEELACTVDPTDKDYVLCKASVSRVLVNAEGKEIILDKTFGTKRQSRVMGNRPDPFWYEKGTMKALRNARIRLIPEEVKSKVLAFAKEQNKTEEAKVENGTPAPPPPKADPKTDELKSKLVDAMQALHEKTGLTKEALWATVSRQEKGGKVFVAKNEDEVMKSVKWAEATYQRILDELGKEK